MDINNFSRQVRKELLRISKRDSFEDPSKEKLLDLINEKLEEKIKMEQLDEILKKVLRYSRIMSELFNLESGGDDGAISDGFTFDGKFLKEYRMSSSVWKMPSEFIRIVNETRTIKPSLKAIEEKEDILSAIEGAKKYRKNDIIEFDIPPEFFTALDKVKQSLEAKVGEDFKDRKIPTFESLTALKRSLIEISAVPTEMRKEYYTYWSGKEKLFNAFVMDFEEGVNPILVDLAGNRELSENEKEKQKKLNELTGENILPSYILKFSPIISREFPDSIKSIMLLKDFLNKVGREVPDKFKNLLPNEEITSQMGNTSVFNPISGEIEGEIDPSLDDDLKEALDELDDLKEDVKIDPLFSILIKNRKVPYAINQKILDQTIKMIKDELDLSGLKDFQQDIQELLDEELDSFIESYKDTYSVENTEYYMPMMDSSDVVSFFDRFKDLTISVNYFKGGVTRTKTFTRYSDAVNFVNENTVRFFCNLVDILEIDLRSAPMLEKPKSVGREVKGSAYFRGGNVVPRPTKSPKAAENKIEAYKSILDVIVKYYIEPLTGSMILLEDTPEFFSDKCFRDLPVILTKNPVVLAERAMLQGVEPIADKEDYNKISELLRTLENPDDIVFNDRLVNLFEDALDSYVKFWTLVAVTTDKKEFSLRDILTDAKIVLGDALYEIAKATESEETLDKEMFRDEPLSFWNKEQERKNVSIKNILPLLGQQSWKAYVVNQNNRERGTKAAYERLVKLLKESDLKLAGELTTAMLEATDMLRKMEGLSIYKAEKDITDIDDLEYVINKIRKEHNIDLYGVDIYNIVKSQSSFNDIGNTFGLSTEIIYKIKGLFR